MSPPTPIHPSSTLPTLINTLPGPSKKQRKPPIRSLTDCALKEMVQYKCNITQSTRKGGKPVIVCEPVVRMYRVCKDGLHVETTAWEGRQGGEMKN